MINDSSVTNDVDFYCLYYDPVRLNKYQKLRVGDEVYDDLTRTYSKIVRIHREVSGTSSNFFYVYGIWLDNDYLGGGRHPWEISPSFNWLRENDPEYFNDNRGD